MGIIEDIATPEGWHAAVAALAWQVDLGVTEVIGDVPMNAYDLPERADWAQRGAAQTTSAQTGGRAPVMPSAPAEPAPAQDAALAAKAAAGAAATLDDLRAAIAAFDLCELKRGARNMVFADGKPGARVMVLGEAPDRDEDIEGRPFVGRAGQLLDRMFAAIGLSRTADDVSQAIYLANAMPWRPPANRDATPEELAMMRPFVERHIELAAPDVVILMGNTPCSALLGAKGILRLRGNWTQAVGRPVLPVAHPAYLLRNPAAKREAWADLLALQAKLRTT
jgi:uracil-DNA glycosylase